MSKHFMEMALIEARKGKGKVLPNPMVGAMVVKGGKVVGRGYHSGCGSAHAEVAAFRGVKVEGTTVYVTLEPCVSFKEKKTGSCAEFLLKKGVKRLFVAQKDPNPMVAGKGISFLRRHGVEVRTGMMRKEATELNAVYVKNMTHSLPYVTVKLASSLDGRIATATGDSRWITGLPARKFVHRLRAESEALLITSSTVLQDDPHLGVRFVKGKDPLRVVLDRTGRTSPKAKVYRDKNVLVVTGGDSSLKISGEHLRVGKRFEIREILRKLYERGVTNVFVEAGGTFAASLLREGLVDKLYYFLAPLFIGGDGKAAVGNLGIEMVSDSIILKNVELHRFDRDILLEATVHCV